MEQINLSSVVMTQEQSFLRRVYNWMASGLGLTAVVALYMGTNEQLIVNMVQSPFIYYGLIIGELVLVFWLSARVSKMALGQATFFFFLYSALNGITLSTIFLIYTKASIAGTFFVAAGMFAATSFYGYVTKKDLSSIGSYCVMGLIGAILVSVVNGFFIHSTGIDWVVSFVVVAISIGLTAYDTQKIKSMGQHSFGDEDVATKGAIMGALSLYLDFIIMFVHLLRFFGNRR